MDFVKVVNIASLIGVGISIWSLVMTYIANHHSKKAEKSALNAESAADQARNITLKKFQDNEERNEFIRIKNSVSELCDAFLKWNNILSGLRDQLNKEKTIKDIRLLFNEIDKSSILYQSQNVKQARQEIEDELNLFLEKLDNKSFTPKQDKEKEALDSIGVISTKLTALHRIVYDRIKELEK